MLIGLTGRKQCGKTTAADYLATAYSFHHDSFAGPMRTFVAEVLGMSLQELEDYKEKPVRWLAETITPRRMLQSLGTEWARMSIHEDLWVLSLVRRVAPLVSIGQNIVISDVRFQNEATAIRSLGGYVVRIERMGQDDSSDTHASEAGVRDDLVDYVLTNNGENASLYFQEVDSLVKRIRRRQRED